MIDFAQHLRENDLIVVPQGTAEPLSLTRQLVADEHQLPAVRLFIGTLFSDTFDAASRLSFLSFGALGTARRLVARDACQVIPCHLSQIPALFEDRLAPDVVLLHLSAESRDGRHSVGIVDDYLQAAIAGARTVIAQVNTAMPYTPGSTMVSLDDVDAYEYVDMPLLEVAPAATTEQARRIGQFAAELIDDGSQIQVGIGTVPDMILHELHGHRNLGIHSGLMTDELMKLHLSGAVTNEGKDVFPGHSVIGSVFGTRDLYKQVSQNDEIMFRPVTVTHAHDVLAKLDKFVSINSAIEIDLTGQVNSEMAGMKYMGAIGGQVDFIRGAAASRGGRSIIALASTDRSGEISRITPSIPSGITTTARSDIDTVITEFGVAELRGRTTTERARALIDIAHPRFRSGLSAHVQG